MTIKSQIIRDALHATGNDPANIASSDDEWIKAERSFERALGSQLVAGKFKFSERDVALVQAGSAEAGDYTYAWNLPADYIDARRVFYQSSTSVNPVAITEYVILNDKLCCNYADGISLRYAYIAPESQWRADFIEAMTLQVEAGCYRAINEDLGEANNREAVARSAFLDAQVTEDQAQPPRRRKNRLRARRAARGTR